RFRHPTVDDFRRVAESVTKKDWRAFFAAYVDRGEIADFAVDRAVSRPTEDGRYLTEVVISRRGGVPQPVTVLLAFADDSSLRRTWDGSQAHGVLRVEHASPLRYAVVDPSWQVVLDNRRYNNYLKAEVAEKTRLRWTAGLTQLAEALLAAVAW